jgi:hypothetical protein
VSAATDLKLLACQPQQRPEPTCLSSATETRSFLLVSRIRDSMLLGSQPQQKPRLLAFQRQQRPRLLACQLQQRLEASSGSFFPSPGNAVAQLLPRWGYDTSPATPQRENTGRAQRKVAVWSDERFIMLANSLWSSWLKLELRYIRQLRKEIIQTKLSVAFRILVWTSFGYVSFLFVAYIYIIEYEY